MTKEYNDIKQKQRKVVSSDEADTNTKPKLDKIVTGATTHRKKSVLERLAKGLIGPDGAGGIGHYLGQEIVLPAIKDIVVNSISSGIQMMVYGSETRTGYRGNTYSRQPGRSNYSRPANNYQQSYTRKNVTTNPSFEEKPRTGTYGHFASDDYLIDSRVEALQVLNALKDQVNEYGSVSVADFFDLIGVDTSFTDNNYGWYDLRYGSVIMSSGGYALRLPPIEDIS